MILTAIIAFLLSCSVALAGQGMGPGPGCKSYSAGGSTTYCNSATTCPATNPGECDSLCEDFNGSSYCVGTSGDQNCRSTWTLFQSGTGSIDWTTTPGGTSPCSDIGSNIVTVTVTDGSSGSVWSKSLGADKPVSYTQFYLYISSETIPDNNSIQIIGTVDSIPSTQPWALALYQESGNRHLRLLYSDSATAAVGTTNLSLSTWYRVNVAYNRTAGTASVKINGTSEITVASGVTGTTPHDILIGSSGFSANAMTMQLMNISVDDDTEPGSCKP